MQRVGDDAGEPGGIEQPLFQVELPRAGLAREQAPLQPVGEPADDAVQLRELLVELGAQPGQLLGIAQVGGVDDLVELQRVRLVGRLLRLPRSAAGKETPPAGLLVVLAFAHGGVGVLVGVFGGLGILVRVDVGLAVAVGVHLVAALGVAGLARVVVVGLLRARLVLGVVRVLGVLVGQVQVPDETPAQRGELVLVAHRAHELRGMPRALGLEPGPPQVGHVAGRLRQVTTGELLAHEHGQRLGHRHLLRRAALVVALAAAALLQRGIEVGRDAGQPLRAQRLHPRLLDRVEDRARRLAARLLAHVRALVVVTQAKRQRVGRAAHQLDVEQVEIARREGKLHLVAGHLRLVRAERDLQFLAHLPGNGLQRRADGPLEGLDRGFLLGHAACSGSGGGLQRRRGLRQLHP